MSATKRVTGPVTMMAAGSMTGTSVITTSIQDVSYLDKGTVLATWTGTPTGTLSIELSVDGQTYTTITPVSDSGSGSINPAGGAGSAQVGLNILRHQKLRVEYTNASGSGTLNVQFIGSAS